MTAGTDLRHERPHHIITAPVRLAPAIDDPDGFLELIARHAPYPTLVSFFGKAMDGYGDARGIEATPWFRAFWAKDGTALAEGIEPVFFSPRLIAAAHQAFGAEIVRPLNLTVNLNPPMAGGAPHLDVPFFRGAFGADWSWLRIRMGISRLFERWEVSAASAIVWFYRGAGGDFEYWPEGPSGPPRRERPPLWNVGVISDNEYMFHRVGGVGAPDEFLAAGAITPAAQLRLAADRTWQIVDAGEVVAAYPAGAVRISFVWKALVFETQAAADRFDNHADDLTLETIVDTLARALRARGVSFREPQDPLKDGAWQAVLASAYPLPGPS
jgi:hypothetical protein